MYDCAEGDPLLIYSKAKRLNKAKIKVRKSRIKNRASLENVSLYFQPADY